MGLTKVSTDGVKDDAIDASKLPANSVGASELADNAVDTNAIADQAVALSKLPHGDGSSNGKFLRANNGADPSFESIPAGTTINNNADNRVITGDANANTLNGESNLSFNGYELALATSGTQIVLQGAGVTKHELLAHSSNNDLTFVNNRGQGNITSNVVFKGSFAGGGTVTERFRITGNGVTFNGDTAAANALDDYEEGTWTPTVTSGGSISSISSARYTKIGRIVHYQVYMNLSSTSSTNNFIINGLPYTAASASQYYYGTGRIQNITSFVWQIDANTNGGNLYSSGGTPITYNTVSNNYVLISGAYEST